MSAENVELPGNAHRWLFLGEPHDADEQHFRCRDCGVKVRVRGYDRGALSFVDGDGFLAFGDCVPTVEVAEVRQ